MLANSIYGGAFHSRLVVNIREQKGYSYSPRSSVSALRQQGYFTVHAAVRNEVAAATLTELFYEMDRMRSLPVTPEELASAQSYLAGVFSLGVATQDGLLGQLSTVHLDQLPEGYLETYRERIRELTAGDVVSAARRHFDSANAQIVLVGDRAQIREQAALFGDVLEYDAQGNEVLA
jgi:predicted Zn-dependent peptidase